MSNISITPNLVFPTINDGLAVFSIDKGCPVLFMPHTHELPTSPTAQCPLALALQKLSYRLMIFDPPGEFHSMRLTQVSMQEILKRARETLQTLKLQDPFSPIGYSMLGLCAIAFILA